MSLKLAVIIGAIIPVILCGSLSPENLQRHFSIIEANINAKIEHARTEIQSYSALFASYYTNITEESLSDDLEAASESYWQQLLSLEVDASEKDITIANCVLETVEEYDLLLNRTLGDYNDTLNNIVDTENGKLENAEVVFETIEQSLNELQSQVSDCSEESCSTQLNEKLAQLYESASRSIDDVLSAIVDYVVVTAPTSLESVNVDITKFQAELEPLITKAQDCFN